MSFANPEFFLILFFLIPLWFFLFREFRLKSKLFYFFNWNKSSLKLGEIWKGLLISGLIVFLVLAFARPQIESFESQFELESKTEVAFCFDLSRSMGLAKQSTDSLSRIDRSKKIALEILENLQGARIAVFGSTSICQELVPLTNDLDLARATIEFLIYTESVGGTGSYFGQAFKTMVGKFKENDYQKFIVFFSDGEMSQNIEDLALLEQALLELKRKNIRLILVGVGEIPGIKIPVFDETAQVIIDYHFSALNEANLKGIADRADGVYFSEKEKDKAISYLKKNLSKPEMKESQTKKRVYKDIGWIFLLPALILWWLVVKNYH